VFGVGIIPPKYTKTPQSTKTRKHQKTAVSRSCPQFPKTHEIQKHKNRSSKGKPKTCIISNSNTSQSNKSPKPQSNQSNLYTATSKHHQTNSNPQINK